MTKLHFMTLVVAYLSSLNDEDVSWEDMEVELAEDRCPWIHEPSVIDHQFAKQILQRLEELS